MYVSMYIFSPFVAGRDIEKGNEKCVSVFVIPLCWNNAMHGCNLVSNTLVRNRFLR